jgi:hypothetical protein
MSETNASWVRAASLCPYIRVSAKFCLNSTPFLIPADCRGVFSAVGVVRGDLPRRISRIELPALLSDLLDDSLRCHGAFPKSFFLTDVLLGPRSLPFSSWNVPCLPMGTWLK